MTSARIALALTFLTAAALCQTPSPEIQVRQVLERYFRALTTGDKTEALKLVRKSARFYDVTGTPATYEYMRDAGPDASQNLFEPNRAHFIRQVQFLNPETALAIGLWRNATAKPRNDSGTFVFALIHGADGWKIESQHHGQIQSADSVDVGVVEAIDSSGVLSEQERNAGWRALFDGKSFRGWASVFGDRPPPGWRIEDGALVSVVGGQRLDIRTKERFQSFELRFEWLMKKGSNSGVKYRLFGLGGSSGSAAFEYQLIDEDEPNLEATQRSGALYGVTPVSKRATKPLGEWNESRLIVTGDHIEHWLNGIQTATYPVDVPFASPIVLQHHKSEVRFRNLKVRPIGK